MNDVKINTPLVRATVDTDARPICKRRIIGGPPSAACAIADLIGVACETTTIACAGAMRSWASNISTSAMPTRRCKVAIDSAPLSGCHSGFLGPTSLRDRRAHLGSGVGRTPRSRSRASDRRPSSASATPRRFDRLAGARHGAGDHARDVVVLLQCHRRPWPAANPPRRGASHTVLAGAPRRCTPCGHGAGRSARRER